MHDCDADIEKVPCHNSMELQMQLDCKFTIINCANKPMPKPHLWIILSISPKAYQTQITAKTSGKEGLVHINSPTANYLATFWSLVLN